MKIPTSYRIKPIRKTKNQTHRFYVQRVIFGFIPFGTLDICYGGCKWAFLDYWTGFLVDFKNPHLALRALQMLIWQRGYNKYKIKSFTRQPRCMKTIKVPPFKIPDCYNEDTDSHPMGQS